MAQYPNREDVELGNQLPTPTPYPAHTLPLFSPPSSYPPSSPQTSPQTSSCPLASHSCVILLSILGLFSIGLIATIIYVTKMDVQYIWIVLLSILIVLVLILLVSWCVNNCTLNFGLPLKRRAVLLPNPPNP
ncbi:hypothetical protein L211DRAFT_833716 [Terfezia boudieri ATCC MYA-4762]|uniref:Uncharacterized protein n=1 Tax=Terfezia boudieri ATCC MYA-4762 TaxID=1051890 RepID=A0A3N4M415_9PEZI|nr:hypothetical protein L211DRAFT_833716 [Terfezia boudieri ATCC MYA-4762]